MTVHTKAALNTFAAFLLAAALFLIVLAISNKHNHSYDVTKDKRLSLSEQSLRLVKDLKKPVRAVVFTNDYQIKEVEKVLDKYKVANPAQFSYRVLDPLRNPGAAKAYNVQYSGQGVLELVEPGQGEQPGKRQERLNDLEEQTITNALLRLSERTELKVGFLTGHGERSLTEQQPAGLLALKGMLEPEAYMPEEFNLGKTLTVPAEYAAVVIASPRSGLLEDEKNALKSYLEGGGRLLFEYDISTDRSYAELLKGYGFEIPDEIVLRRGPTGQFSQDSVLVTGEPMSKVHPVVKEQREQDVLMLSHAVKLGEAKQANGYQAESLIASDPGCLAVPVAQILGNKIQIDMSKKASYPLISVSSKKVASQPAASPSPASPSPSASPSPANERESRIAVIGGEMLSNQLIKAGGNRDTTVNLLSWLVQAESRITIRPSEETSKPFYLGPSQLEKIVLVNLLLIPAIFLLIGILSAIKRR